MHMHPCWLPHKLLPLTPLAAAQVRVVNAPSVRDAFAAEVVKLSPPLLKTIDFHGCHNLHKLVLSPQSSCPALEALHLSSCPGLEYVLLQSNSVKQVDLTNCEALTKVTLRELPKPRIRLHGTSSDGSLLTRGCWSRHEQQMRLTPQVPHCHGISVNTYLGCGRGVNASVVRLLLSQMML